MRPVELKKDIYWVGWIDFDKRNFHGYSRSPDGTTSNAYLIMDQKNVLLDTVPEGQEGSLLCRMAKVLPPEKVDYIICNHMELDHQGALKAIVERCKPERIFVSQIGLNSMAGYYGAEKDWPIQAVKTGDSIDIGSRKLIFQETRMLHWPDSMVTYSPNDKILFSNDIFGQNIASTERFTDQYANKAEFAHRIKEYYYNIVLPYSAIALKTLPVVEKLDIDMIAPDHGLIHRGIDAVHYIINMYREMAEQKPKQRAVIFYDTMWESTEKMAYAICSGMAENGVPSRIMSLKKNHHSAVMTELADCGAALAGSPTHNNDIMSTLANMLCYMKGLRPINRIGGAFGSYGWSGESPRVLQSIFKEMKFDLPCEPLRCHWAPTKEDYKACHRFGKDIAEALKKKCQES